MSKVSRVARLLQVVAGSLLLMVFQGETTPAATNVEAEMPVYVAPQHITPRARLGGSLRGAAGEDPVVAALVPDHVGLTIRKQPELNWFLSKRTSLPIRFTLIDERSIRALLERSLAPPYEAGVHVGLGRQESVVATQGGPANPASGADGAREHRAVLAFQVKRGGGRA